MVCPPLHSGRTWGGLPMLGSDRDVCARTRTHTHATPATTHTRHARAHAHTHVTLRPTQAVFEKAALRPPHPGARAGWLGPLRPQNLGGVHEGVCVGGGWAPLHSVPGCVLPKRSHKWRRVLVGGWGHVPCSPTHLSPSGPVHRLTQGPGNLSCASCDQVPSLLGAGTTCHSPPFGGVASRHRARPDNGRWTFSNLTKPDIKWLGVRPSGLELDSPRLTSNPTAVAAAGLPKHVLRLLQPHHARHQVAGRAPLWPGPLQHPRAVPAAHDRGWHQDGQEDGGLGLG